MAFLTRDFVKETSTVTGTGAINLLGARSPAQTFAAVAANGDTFHYAISHTTANEWETGLGTYNSGPNTITRTTVLASSNGGSAVNFSAGTKFVDLVLPATRVNQFLSNVSAAGTSAALGALVFSNSNGVSFGLNGSTITASVAPGGGGGGIAAGILASQVTNGTLIFSNSNNVSWGMAGSTIFASASFPSLAISAGGNSVSSGTITFSNANGVSFGMAGSTLTASVLAGAGIAAVGAGTQTLTAGTLVFSNSNGMIFGINGSTLTAQPPPDVRIGLVSHVGGNSVGAVSRLAFEDGTNISWSLSTVAFGATVLASVPTQTSLVFSNSNNVTFGLAGSTVTASATVASTQGSISFSAGTTNVLGSAVVFSNANGVSFGLNGSTITASVAPGGGGGAAISAAGASASNGTVVFSNSNGVSFGMAGSTVTASVPKILGIVSHIGGTSVSDVSALVFSNAFNVNWLISSGAGGATIQASATGAGGGGATLGMFMPFEGELVVQTLSVGASYVQGPVWLMPVVFPQAVAMDRMVSLMSFTASTGQTVTHTISQFVALYTRNAGTLSLAHSQSGTVSFNQSGSGNSSLIFGARNVSMGWTTTIPAGNYWMAYQRRLSGGNTASHSMSLGMLSQALTFAFANLGAAANNTNQLLLGQGFYTATTASPPTSIAFSQISGANSGISSIAQRRPWLHFVSGTA